MEYDWPLVSFIYYSRKIIQKSNISYPLCVRTKWMTLFKNLQCSHYQQNYQQIFQSGIFNVHINGIQLRAWTNTRFIAAADDDVYP